MSNRPQGVKRQASLAQCGRAGRRGDLIGPSRKASGRAGNAYSVNVVGRILAPFLKALIDRDALKEIPLVKPAASAKGQTNLGAWLKKSADPWIEISPEEFADNARFERFSDLPITPRLRCALG